MRGLPHFFFRPTDDASRLSLLRQNAQIKGVVRNCVIRRLPLIPLLRLAILCAKPQVTEFQQQEPLRAFGNAFKQTTSIIGEEKTASRSFPCRRLGITEGSA
jgi:hypothetical protein